MKKFQYAILITIFLTSLPACTRTGQGIDILREGFTEPPHSAKPGVYWYFMDGNQSREAITKDLESMKEAGLGHLVYLEVNVGVARGTVDLLSPEWKELFKHAVGEAERLGIAITLGVGPGWTGSGGPWVRPEQSMRHLVASVANAEGPGIKTIVTTVPPPRDPFFGTGGFTPEMHKDWEEYYEDVAVLAFPAKDGSVIGDTDEKALYYRAPYSSMLNVKQYLPTMGTYPSQPGDVPVDRNRMIDLTDRLKADGSVEWDVPEGKWTVMRFGVRNNGAVTRPAPLPGVGMESDKFDRTALDAHLDVFPGLLFEYIGQRDGSLEGGLKMLHMDSWEMGAQNWTDKFRDEFMRRRGYDPQPFYPAYTGVIVDSRETSERFLWDLRLTSQELVLENHAGHIKEYAHRHGYGLSIEPYDMNPTADLELGSVADMPMAEFWSVGYGYNTAFSAITGPSIAHIKGQPVVPAEAFTAQWVGWRQYPGSMKDQTDWAFAAGINRLMYHTFAHQALPDHLRPGMTMGPYGVHWDRNQTWWYMSDAYHSYVSRSQFMLQQGRTVADVLYLSPEGAPHVFHAPESALDYKTFDVADGKGKPFSLPDRRGYNFDGCPPGLLYDAFVKNGMVKFPSGAEYRVLVLPVFETMTPRLLRKVKELLRDGATVVGLPPRQSPSLSGYPRCDHEVAELVKDIWGGYDIPEGLTFHKAGKGTLVWGKDISARTDNLYPDYSVTSSVLGHAGIEEDFSVSAPGVIRYSHRTSQDYDIYFLSNRTDRRVSVDCTFRIGGRAPELWNAVTGEMRPIAEYTAETGMTTIPLKFEPSESFFIVFPANSGISSGEKMGFSGKKQMFTLNGPWKVSFDPKWGGPAEVIFDTLADWTKRPEDGIRFYSGTAFYNKTFKLDEIPGCKLWLDLGKVKNMAKVYLNDQDLGVVWTYPWGVDITDAVREGENSLKVEVVNLWPNRLIGDEHLPDDGIENGQWPEWLLEGKPRPGSRYTFTTYRHYTKDSPLLESGLLGPVTVMREE